MIACVLKARCLCFNPSKVFLPQNPEPRSCVINEMDKCRWYLVRDVEWLRAGLRISGPKQ